MQQMERSVHKKFYKDNNTFKIYLIDCRLLASPSDSRPKDMLLYDKAFTEFKDANTESFFLQQLVDIRDVHTYYYSKGKSTLGIELLAQYDSKVFPCEVKAEENVKTKSLRTFVAYEFPDLSLHAFQFSMLPYINQQWMENMPLSCIGGCFWPI